MPKYPGVAAGRSRPGLLVQLRKLSRDQARVFMEIEYPQGGPLALAAGVDSFNAIGEFYEAILAAFKELNPTLSLDCQLELDLRNDPFLQD